MREIDEKERENDTEKSERQIVRNKINKTHN